MGLGSKLKKLANPFSSSNPITGSINQQISSKLLPQEFENFTNKPGTAIKDRLRKYDDTRKATGESLKAISRKQDNKALWVGLGKQVLDEENASRSVLSVGDPLTDEMNRGQRSARNKVDAYVKPMLLGPGEETPMTDGPTGAGAVNTKTMGNTAFTSSALYEEGILPGSINTENYKK